MREGVERRALAPILGTLGLLVVVNVPTLGDEAWRFAAHDVRAQGILAPLVRVAHEHWDLGVLRTPAMLAGLLVVAAGAAAFRWTLPRWLVLALALAVIGLLLVPATLLQIGLRDSSAPWLYVNDSTYQIEIGGDLVLDGENPYGHDYRDTSLANWYRDVRPQPPSPYVALDHFAYFPGTPLLAAVWRLLPRPLDDVRLLVLLATLGAFFAALLFDAPWERRVAAGAALAANPLAVHAAWYGTADAPSLLALLLAFALALRGRYASAGVALGAAILLKQFALIAVPFLAVLLLQRDPARRSLKRAAAGSGAVLVAGFAPFLLASPRALWDDTVAYGGSTYRIVGYGLSNLLVRLGVIDDRFGSYPFIPLALLVWLPLTAWLVWTQWRERELWVAPAAFAISSFVLFFVSRVFQTSYLAWPFLGLVLAWLFFDARSAAAARTGPSP